MSEPVSKIKALDSSVLFTVLNIVTVLPGMLSALGVRSMFIALTIFVANLAVCGAGYMTGQRRWFWVTWAMLCCVSLFFLGFTNPLVAIWVLVRAGA